MSRTTTIIDVERIDSHDGLVALAGAWDAVQSDCAAKHVQLDHRWMCPWWSHFGDGKELHALVLRRGSGIIGIAPLIISRGREVFPSRLSCVQIADDYACMRTAPRLVPIRRLTFPLSYMSGNQRCHMLLREESSDVYEAIARYVRSIASRWDMLMLEGLPRDSGQAQRMLDAARRHGLRADGRTFERRLGFVTLPDTMQGYMASRTRHFRKRFGQECQRVERKASSMGGLTIAEFRGPSIDEGLDHLFSMERRSWKAQQVRRRQIHHRLDDRLRDFHGDVARRFSERGEAAVFVTFVAHDVVGALYCLEREGVVTPILTYMDAAFARQVTALPMFRRFIECSIDRGLREIDVNGNTMFARKLSNGERVLERVVLYSARPYSSLLRNVSRAARSLSRAVSRARETDSGSREPEA